MTAKMLLIQNDVTTKPVPYTTYLSEPLGKNRVYVAIIEYFVNVMAVE
jgi:hypothetical protein